MPKIKTSDCPILPAHMHGQKPDIPCPHLLDDDVDIALDYIEQRGGLADTYPNTKYGRRVAVERFLRMEAYSPVDEVSMPWETYHPSQPR